MSNHLPDCMSELGRAINRLDFYRLFKALSVEFDVELMTLFEMNNWPEEEATESLMVVVNTGEHIDLDLDTVVVSANNEIFSDLRNSIFHKVWNSDQLTKHIDFCGQITKSYGLTIPLHTQNGRHFGFWLMLDEKSVQTDQANMISLCLKMVFERFFNELLAPTSFPVISSRELEVIKWSAEGKTSIDIAIILGLSEHTINSYTTKILQKLQVVNRAQMVAMAIRMGLIK
jgi:LuxR family transcriptional regulator